MLGDDRGPVAGVVPRRAVPPARPPQRGQRQRLAADPGQPQAAGGQHGRRDVQQRPASAAATMISDQQGAEHRERPGRAETEQPDAAAAAPSAVVRGVLVPGRRSSLAPFRTAWRRHGLGCLAARAALRLPRARPPPPRPGRRRAAAVRRLPRRGRGACGGGARAAPAPAGMPDVPGVPGRASGAAAACRTPAPGACAPLGPPSGGAELGGHQAGLLGGTGPARPAGGAAHRADRDRAAERRLQEAAARGRIGDRARWSR